MQSLAIESYEAEERGFSRVSQEESTVIHITRKEKLIAMPSRNRGSSSSGVLVRMPSRNECIEAKTSKLVAFPSRISRAAEVLTIDKRQPQSIVRSGYEALSLGFRMTLLALFALLGWPHPTRDNDPGPSAARPSHWEMVSLISRLRIPDGRTKAAVAQVPQPPTVVDGKALPSAA